MIFPCSSQDSGKFPWLQIIPKYCLCLIPFVLFIVRWMFTVREQNWRSHSRGLCTTYVDLMVMQRSCSSFRVSVKRVSPARDEAMIPALDTSESVRVDFPWSTWAITDMFLMLDFLSMMARIWSTENFTWVRGGIVVRGLAIKVIYLQPAEVHLMHHMRLFDDVRYQT